MTNSFQARLAQPSRGTFLDEGVGSSGSEVIFRRTEPGFWDEGCADRNVSQLSRVRASPPLQFSVPLRKLEHNAFYLSNVQHVCLLKCCTAVLFNCSLAQSDHIPGTTGPSAFRGLVTLHPILGQRLHGATLRKYTSLHAIHNSVGSSQPR